MFFKNLYFKHYNKNYKNNKSVRAIERNNLK